MSKKVLCSLLIALSAVTIGAAASDMLTPERWQANSSGQLALSTDPADQSLIVKARFAAENDGLKNWAYPVLTLQESELPDTPKSLTVELKYKCENSEKPRTFKIMLGMLDAEGKKFSHAFSCDAAPDWKSFAFDLTPIVKDGKKLTSINIGMGAKGKTFEYQIRNLNFSGDQVKKIDTSSAVKVITNEPALLHTAGEPVEFQFSLPDNMPVEYEIVNYRNETILRGEVPDDRKLTVPCPEPDYYRLILSGRGAIFENFRSFAVLPHSDSRKWINHPFAADTAWGGSLDFFKNSAGDKKIQTENWAEYWTRVTELCAFSRIRMRGSWYQFEAKPGEYAMDGDTQRLIDKCTERNIHYSMMFHGAPGFLRRKGSRCELAADPFDTWKFMRQYALAQGPTCEGIEFFNELDHADLSLYPTWEVATHLKAAALGLKAARQDLKLIAVSSTLNIGPGRWQWELFDQDLTQYVDAFNHHIYDPVPSIESRWKRDFKNIVSAHSAPDMSIWVTENSTRAEGGGMTPYGVDSKGNPKYDHSFDQEMMLAEFHVKMMISAQFSGTEANFLFLLRPYDEGQKRWGSVRWKDFSAKPTLVAMAQMIYRIGGADLLGEYHLTDKQRAFLYQLPDGSQTLMFWTRTEVDGDAARLALAMQSIKDARSTTFSLQIPAGAKCFGTFGAPEKLDIVFGAPTLVTAYRLPSYLTGLRGLKATVPFQKPVFSGAVDFGRDKTVVFQIESALPVMSAGDALMVDAGAAPVIVLKCHNFSDENKIGKIKVSGAAVENLPSTVTIEPMSSAVFELKLASKGDSIFPQLVFEGEFNGRPTTRLFLPVYRRDLATDHNRFEIIGNTEKNYQGTKAVLTIPEYSGNIKGVEFDVFTPADGKLAGGIKLIHYTLTDNNGNTRTISWGKYAAENGKWINNRLRVAAAPGEKLREVVIEPLNLPKEGSVKVRDFRLIVDNN